MTNVRIKITVGRPDPHGEVERGEIEESVKMLQVGKAPGVDGITAEVLKY